jgi:hypothetical protein
MTKGKTPRRRHSSATGGAILDMLKKAVKQGLHFTADERVELLAESKKSGDDARRILESRGYTQDAKGRWGYHKHPVH